MYLDREAHIVPSEVADFEKNMSAFILVGVELTVLRGTIK